mgnify:CR=1 FL=1
MCLFYRWFTCVPKAHDKTKGIRFTSKALLYHAWHDTQIVWDKNKLQDALCIVLQCKISKMTKEAKIDSKKNFIANTITHNL